MRIALDTEFLEDGKTIELISIGLVREDGETYYAEVPTASEISGTSLWLAEHVQPYLTGPRKAKTQIAHEIVEFVDHEPEFWAWYASYDWVVLCQLYGEMLHLPPTWPMWCNDFRQVCSADSLPDQDPAIDGPEHHALSDAKWLMRSMEYFREHAYVDLTPPATLPKVI